MLGIEESHVDLELDRCKIPKNLNRDLLKSRLSQEAEILLSGVDDSKNDFLIYTHSKKQKNPDVKEIDLLNYVDSILNDIQLKGFDTQNCVDTDLKFKIKKIILLLYRRRNGQGIKKYDEDAIRILVYECWYADHLHRMRSPRKSGELYSRSHLFGSVENAICDAGLTGLATLIAVLRHDDFEDLPIHKPHRDRSKLLCDQLYTPDFKNAATIDKKERILAQVAEIVTVLTNLKENEGDDFYKFLLAINKKGIRAAIVRLFERTHNIDTLKGHANEEKQRRIAYRTINIHSRIARSLKLSRVLEHLLQGCFAEFNPQALQNFLNLQNSRIEEHLGVDIKQSKLYQKLQVIGETFTEIDSIRINPISFVNYLDSRKLTDEDPFEKIESWDPLFEVLISVNERAQIDDIKYLVLGILNRGLKHRSYVEFKEASPNEVPYQGVILGIYNKAFGGRVKIRINDKKSEARKIRGVLASGPDSDAPESFYDAIGEIIDTTKKNIKKKVGDISDDADFPVYEAIERKLKPAITVMSKDNNPIELPIGSKAIDFAAKIPYDFFGRYSYAMVRKGPMSKARPLKPFDYLSEGDVVEIVLVNEDGSGSKVDLGWLCFANPSTLLRLRKFFNKENNSNPERGTMRREEYYKRIAELFGIRKVSDLKRILVNLRGNYQMVIFKEKADHHLKNLRKMMESHDPKLQVPERALESATQKSRNANEKYDILMSRLDKDFGSGRLNSLELLSSSIDHNEIFKLVIELPNKAGMLHELSQEFKRDHVNIVNINQTNKEDGSSEITLDIKMEDDKFGTNKAYDLLKCLFRINYDFPVRVISDQFRRLVPKTAKPEKRKPSTISDVKSEEPEQ